MTAPAYRYTPFLSGATNGWEQVLRVRSEDNTVNTRPLEIVVSNGQVTDLGGGAVALTIPSAVGPGSGITESLFVRGTQTSVAPSSQVTVTTFTNTGTMFWLDMIVGSGQIDAEWEIVIDASIKINGRSNGMDCLFSMPFPRPVRIPVGSIIDVKVTHYFSSACDFEASIVGHRED
jgi:hypothetical protein